MGFWKKAIRWLDYHAVCEEIDIIENSDFKRLENILPVFDKIEGDIKAIQMEKEKNLHNSPDEIIFNGETGSETIVKLTNYFKNRDPKCSDVYDRCLNCTVRGRKRKYYLKGEIDGFAIRFKFNLEGKITS